MIVLTGEDVHPTVSRIFQPRESFPADGRLALGWIVAGDRRLDEAVVCLHADWAEINIHGGPHVARQVLSLLADCGVAIAPDARGDPALATEAGNADNPAIAAEMLGALRSARTPLAVAAVTAQWSAGLTDLARAENPDGAALRAAADALPLMNRLLDPPEVVIAGPPNAGKSALTNALVGQEVSIVSDTPGTTRDWVRSLADLDGLAVWLTDTAGLALPTGRRQAGAGGEGVEAEAVRRAWERIEAADVVVCVVPPAEPGVTGGMAKRRMFGHGQASLDHGAHLLARLCSLPNALTVAGKCDLAPPAEPGVAGVSAQTFAGLPELRGSICSRLGFDGFDPARPRAFTIRQAELLRAAADELDNGQAPAARALLDRLLRLR